MKPLLFYPLLLSSSSPFLFILSFPFASVISGTLTGRQKIDRFGPSPLNYGCKFGKVRLAIYTYVNSLDYT